MKKEFVLILVVLLIWGMLAGCSPQAADSDGIPDPSGPVKPAAPGQPEDPLEPPEPERPESLVNEYSLICPGGVLTLQAWADQLDHEVFLGKPEEMDLDQLENADTFNGSWVRTEIYNGLTLEWFSPKGDGQRFWLYKAQTKDPQYRTVRNIGVGSTRQEMEAAYPDIRQALDGRTDPDNSAYEWSEEPLIYDQGRFEMQDGVICQILLVHVFP